MALKRMAQYNEKIYICVQALQGSFYIEDVRGWLIST